MATLYDNYTTTNTSKTSPYGVTWRCQTFTPSTPYTITYVELQLYKTGSPGTMNVGIYATSGGKPTGSALCSGSINANTFTGSEAWYTITLGSGVALSAGTKYAIVFSAPSGSSGNNVDTSCNTSATYAGGSEGYSTNSGSTWTMEAAVDIGFQNYGNPPVSATNSNFLQFM